MMRGRILKLDPNNRGYAQISVYADGRRTKYLVHRLVLTAFVGPCPDGMEGCHNDGDQANNSLANLRWDTPDANGADRVNHWQRDGRHCRACSRGHLLLPGNLVPSMLARGSRSCLSCSRGRARIQDAQKRGRNHGTLAEVSAPIYAEIARIHAFPSHL